MAKKNVRRMGRKVLSLLMALTMVTSIMQVSAFAAPFGFDANENSERGNWSYAYYLGQEYLGNASGDPVKPDPVGYGFQGVITDITFTDDVGTEWTFVWSSVANGEWRITGSNVSESKAKAWPQITVDKVYVGTCGDEEYRFTLSADGSAADWTYARNNYANWFYYIRFVRDYTVNVYYQNETGDVIYNEVVYAAAAPETGEFTFYYPDGGIIDDSELEDGEYTDPVTLLPENFLSDEMKAQGYEITAATDANGNDVLTDGVTISLIHENVLNVYCTLKAPETDTYKVFHEYYTNEIIDNTVEDELEIQAGTVINAELIEELKNPVNEELTYEFTSYDVDPATKTITLIYNRVYEPTADPVDSVIRYGVEKIWVDENAPTGHVRPESVTVELYADGKATGESVVLSEENNWAYTWSDLPAGKDYVAVETVPENYQVTSRQVAEGKYTVKGSLERIPSCSETEIEVPAADVPSFIVVSLTNKNDVRKVFGKYDYVVWSDYELSDASKSELVELVAADSEGNFNKIELKNTLFLYDGGANPYAEYVSFERSGESVVGTSLKTSAVWSQILYGAADAAPAYTELTNTVVVPPATGSLEITKVVEGEANVPADAAFTVVGPNGYSQTIAYSEFKGGKYMLEGLELGAYTVSENETSAQVSGYELTIRENNAEIEVKENETAAVTITNTYEAIRIPTGSLTVQKNIVGLADGAVMPDNTKFQLLKGDELVAEVTWADFNQETNSYTFVNLPLGNYSINEVGGAVSGYSGPSLLKVYDGNGGNGFAAVTDGGNASAVITNTYEKVYVPQPALSVTKVADVETAKAGDEITYTITVTNTGDANSTNVVIVDTPDRNLTIGEISNGGVYENGKITWNVATLPAGISWSATVKATVKNTDAEQVENTVVASDDANNSDNDTAVVTLKGSLTIVKQIRGLDARSESKLKEVLSFTVTDPNGESSEYSYSDFRSGKLEIEDPIPGVYTVTERNAEVDGYILDNGDGNWEIEIREGGRAKTLNIVNKYTGKTYNIWFDGGNHGDVRNDLGNPVTGVWRNLWTEIHADESYFDWSGFGLKEGWKVYQMGINDTNNLYDDLAENHEIAEGTSVVLYHFTWAQWLDYKQEMSEGKPGLEIEQGWKSDREFYLDGGETAFASFEAAVEYMNANPDSTVDANGFYNAYYVAKYENDPVPPYVPPTYEPDPDPVVPPVVIVEPEVPLVELPEEEVPLADEPLVEIPEEEVPLADVPKTGDALVLQMILTSGTGLGMIALALSGKKREEEDV